MGYSNEFKTMSVTIRILLFQLFQIFFYIFKIKINFLILYLYSITKSKFFEWCWSSKTFNIEILNSHEHTHTYQNTVSFLLIHSKFILYLFIWYINRLSVAILFLFLSLTNKIQKKIVKQVNLEFTCSLCYCHLFNWILPSSICESTKP